MKQSKSKRRFIGLEFKLDGIPKDELDTLKIVTGFVDGKFNARIKTDKHEILTNAIKGFQRENKPGFNLKKIYHKSASNSMEPSSFLENIDVILANRNTYPFGLTSGISR